MRERESLKRGGGGRQGGVLVSFRLHLASLTHWLVEPGAEFMMGSQEGKGCYFSYQ